MGPGVAAIGKDDETHGVFRCGQCLDFFRCRSDRFESEMEGAVARGRQWKARAEFAPWHEMRAEVGIGGEPLDRNASAVSGNKMGDFFASVRLGESIERHFDLARPWEGVEGKERVTGEVSRVDAAGHAMDGMPQGVIGGIDRRAEAVACLSGGLNRAGAGEDVVELVEEKRPPRWLERLLDPGALARGLRRDETAFGVAVELFDVAPCGVASARVVLELSFAKRKIFGSGRCEDFRQIFTHGAELENGQRRVLLQLGDAGEMFLGRPAAVIADAKPEDPMIEAG